MRRTLLVLLCTGCLWSIAAIKGESRSEYKGVILKVPAESKAEMAVLKQVKAQSCKACHGKKSKKVRTEYGMKLHDALGGGDKKKYKFAKPLWKKDDKENYSPKAVKLLRDAVNAAAKKKKAT
jgi:hypothetical protein